MPNITSPFLFCGINRHMMNTLKSRLLNAAFIVGTAALAPIAAAAQDATAPDPTASNWIGGLVVWLLPLGGAGAVFTMFALDKSAQQSRSSRR